jgi:hypothetical protein
MRTSSLLAALFVWLMLLAACGGGNSKKAGDSLAVNVDSASGPQEETEEEEMERILRERQEEDEKAYAELGMYNGTYQLQTESEGATGTLNLSYSSDRIFNFKLELSVVDFCKGLIEGEVTMDRTQHGFYNTEGCYLHFNFLGSWGSNLIVEIEQDGSCTHMEGDCIFGGTYTQ